MKITVTSINGQSCQFPAYGPFVSPNRSRYWLVHAPSYCTTTDVAEFFIIESRTPPYELWKRCNEPEVHFSFAMACLALLNETEKSGEVLEAGDA